MKKVATVLVAMVGIGSSADALAQTEQPPAIATETVFVGYQPEEDLTAPLIIDELDPETVLTVRATGFDANTTGAVKQCVRGSERRCLNRLPVRFDGDGAATFQYLITDAVGSAAGVGEPCRLSAERCTIELGAAGKLAIIDTVFVDDAPPPGRLEVTPRRGLLVGDTVTVKASQFQPGVELTVMICAEPSTSGARCGAPSPEVPLTIGRDGTAQTEMALDATEVGSNRVGCGRRVGCRMVVTADQLTVRARPVTLSFDDAPGADYVATRVMIGLGTAVALLLLAAWLVRSTDWIPPRESNSSPIDQAEYADLDREAAEFADAEPIPSH